MSSDLPTAVSSPRASPADHERARHVVAVLAALSLLLVSTAAVAVDTPEGPSALPTAQAELPTGPARWRADTVPPRAAVEVASRQPLAAATAPWSDPSSTRVRYVQWGRAGDDAALGLSLGVSSWQRGSRAAPWGATPDTLNTALRPEVGLRWRSGWRADRRVDVDAWGAYDPSPLTPATERRSFNARVELQFRDNRPRLGFDGSRGALGLQLSSNSQMLLRAKHGGPMLYYRARW